MPGYRKQPKIKVNVPKAQRPKEWSKDLTSLENFAIQGIVADPNTSIGFTQKLNESRKKNKPKAELPLSKFEDQIPLGPLCQEKSLPAVIPDHRISQLEELISRYGTDNFQKMHLDRKYNYKQETAKQLKKAVEQYLRWKALQDQLEEDQLNKEKEEEELELENKKSIIEEVELRKAEQAGDSSEEYDEEEHQRQKSTRSNKKRKRSSKSSRGAKQSTKKRKSEE